MERILDLGCGAGDSWSRIGVEVDGCHVTGLDIARESLHAAHVKYKDRGWRYVCARGEDLPLQSDSLDGVLCNVALPYMHIPQALSELHRVLVAGGWLKATLHPPDFTWSEFRKSFPRLKPSLFRVFVLLNGVVFHLSGRVISFGKVAESCQTTAGMRIALQRAGFTDLNFRREGKRFFVEARRPGTEVAAEPPVLARAG
jgi:ubiquinone/menaquinone biosynthesis C-methylase UbiE